MPVTASGMVRLTPDDPDQVDAIARLHTELLPDSFTARLGHFFMTRFYFTKMVESDLVACDLYAQDGAYVAFNVFTKRPDTFMREGIRRHFFSLCWISAIAFLADPRRLAVLPGMFRKDAWLQQEQGTQAGYWLTFGVLESHRRLKVDERGLRISNVLVQGMLDYFRKEGFDRLDGGVERDNKSAIFFYHSCGFEIHDPGSGPALHIRYDLKRS